MTPQSDWTEWWRRRRWKGNLKGEDISDPNDAQTSSNIINSVEQVNQYGKTERGNKGNGEMASCGSQLHSKTMRTWGMSSNVCACFNYSHWNDLALCPQFGNYNLDQIESIWKMEFLEEGKGNQSEEGETILYLHDHFICFMSQAKTQNTNWCDFMWDLLSILVPCHTKIFIL